MSQAPHSGSGDDVIACSPLAPVSVDGNSHALGLQLSAQFYERSVHDVARDLIGCTVAHGDTAGVIVETESYHADDEACHAYIGLTARNRVLFGPPAHAYVYLSYGVHSLLNFVAEPEGEAAAVLIRALEPVEGIEVMRARRGVDRVEELCSGPGKLTQALGIGLELNGVPLLDGPIRVSGRANGRSEPRIVRSERVGITKAADLPWRFSAAGSPFVSRPRPPALSALAGP
jgi:DNA-3-methyladenine glycosylase